MYSTNSRGDYEPLGFCGGYPIYVTTLVLAACVAGLVLGILAVVVPIPALGFVLSYESAQVWTKGQIWRVLTYPFFNIPTFFSIFSLLFVFWYGRELESYLGRARTITFYLIAILTPAVLATLFWLCGAGSTGLSSSYYLSTATLIGFGTLYPNVEIFGGIRMKWIIWVCIGLACIGPLAARDWPSLCIILGECGAAFGYVRWLQLGGEFPRFALPKFFGRKPKLRVLPDPVTEADGALASVDAILDKIGKHGIGSLSAKERASLERGREELLRRERGREQ